jgi:uncharacterized protein (TIGR03067 family)
MKPMFKLASMTVLACCLTSLSPARAADTEPGFKSLFNGTDLSGWEGLNQFWSVQDGVITGRTTKENPAKGNTFLVWKGGDVDDFELRLSYKLTPGGEHGFANSGVQYRSKIVDPNYFVVGGYQGDMEAGKMFSGILYEERGRGILAQRGQKVVITADPNDPNKPKINVVGTLGDSAEIQSHIKSDGWNDYVIIAKGNHLQHFINGLPTIDVTDEQTSKAARSGIMALQLHAGDPMMAQFKDIRIKSLSGRAAADSDLEQVQGNWVPTQIIDKGDATAKEALATFKLKVTGNQFTLNRPDGAYAGKFTLNSASQPKGVDITLDDGTEVPAIIDITAAEVRVCYSESSGSRPTGFKSAAGSDNVLLVCKRRP